MLKLFFSYSHIDEARRNTLEVHLATLKRQGLIESWHDRRIEVGQEFAGVIDENLKEADVVLLLVSPYFLASDYCYEIEMAEALRRHEKGEAKVLPIILESCDWKTTPFSKLLVLPQDGKPISKYSNQHDAFLEIVEAIRKVIPQKIPLTKNINQKLPEQQIKAPTQVMPNPRSSNLRLKKSFSEKEKDDFLEEAFDYMCKFFEGSLQELEARNKDINCKLRRVDANHFTAFIYKHGKAVAECKIWLALRGNFMHGIIYSNNTGADDNSFNESISVTDDEYNLGLKPIGMSSIFRQQNSNEALTPTGASEYYWGLFIGRLQ